MGKRILIDADCLIGHYRDKLELDLEDSHYSEISLYESIKETKNIKKNEELLKIISSGVAW